MHAHTCRCGSELTCAREDCAVIDPYQCPTCDHEERDQYFQQLEMFYWSVANIKELVNLAPQPPFLTEETDPDEPL